MPLEDSEIKSPKEQRMDMFMEMGKIIEEELGWKMTGFDPHLHFRDEDWQSLYIPLDFARVLVTKLIVMRVSREVLDEVEKTGLMSNIIKNVEERVDAQIPQNIKCV